MCKFSHGPEALLQLEVGANREEEKSFDILELKIN